jgi:hypothetical protein
MTDNYVLLLLFGLFAILIVAVPGIPTVLAWFNRHQDEQESVSEDTLRKKNVELEEFSAVVTSFVPEKESGKQEAQWITLREVIKTCRNNQVVLDYAISNGEATPTGIKREILFALLNERSYRRQFAIIANGQKETEVKWQDISFKSECVWDQINHFQDLVCDPVDGNKILFRFQRTN